MSPVVALVPDLLLDTHIVVWMAVDPDKIPVSVLQTIAEACHRYVSHMTALEIQIKNQKNPELFPFTLAHYEASMKEFSMEELPLTYSDIKAMSKMEFLHRDPFDRLLITQAATRNLPLVTQDSDIVRTARQFKTFDVLVD